MRTLASEFGVSDVGLAKLCHRYNIPTPGLGHWRLVETGHPPKRVPLPPMQSPGNENVVIPAREPRPYELPQKRDLPPVPKIEVKEDREITHPIVIRTRKAFEPTSKDDKGWFVPHNLKAPHLRVSKHSAPRAFRIFDALFFALEAQGYSVDWSKEPDSRPHVLVDGERILFSLAETFSRKPHALTREETERKNKNLYVYAPQWDYAPSGILRLSFEGLPYELKHIRKSWGDGSTQRLEDCLADFVSILPHLAKALKAVAEEAERKQKQWQEEQSRREEARRQQEEYDRKSKVVDQFLDYWNRSKAFHELARSIDAKLEDSAIPENERAELREISAWISRHAENCNPIAHFDWMIRKFNESHSPWKY
ncbi:MAG: hypothetical protein WB780_12705 [Candidatus Acidiferrales bacterium]